MSRGQRYPDELREEAFLIFSDGKPTRIVARELREKYGLTNAPTAETVRLWSRKENWRRRRERIRRKSEKLTDNWLAEIKSEMLRRVYALWDKAMSACEQIHYQATNDKPIRDLVAVDRIFHAHGKQFDSDHPDRDDIDAIIEHFFKVLYADEEVGPVLARRRYLIEAALERSRDGVVR